MKTLMIPLLMLLAANQGYSQKTIPLEDVGKLIGDIVSVWGKVSGTRFLVTANAKCKTGIFNLGKLKDQY